MSADEFNRLYCLLINVRIATTKRLNKTLRAEYDTVLNIMENERQRLILNGEWPNDNAKS